MATFLKLDADYINANNIKKISEYEVNANQEKYDSWYLKAQKVISEYGNINSDMMISSNCIYPPFKERQKIVEENIKQLVFDTIGKPPEYITKLKYKVITNDDEIYDLDYNPFKKYISIG